MKEMGKYIEANPEIMYGKAVFKGTRIPVELILGKIAKGQNFEEIANRILYRLKPKYIPDSGFWRSV